MWSRPHNNVVVTLEFDVITSFCYVEVVTEGYIVRTLIRTSEDTKVMLIDCIILYAFFHKARLFRGMREMAKGCNKAWGQCTNLVRNR